MAYLASSLTVAVLVSRDPSGWDNEPTDADYKAFEVWAVSTYGRKTYDEYMRGPSAE